MSFQSTEEFILDAKASLSSRHRKKYNAPLTYLRHPRLHLMGAVHKSCFCASYKVAIHTKKCY